MYTRRRDLISKIKKKNQTCDIVNETAKEN